jgi:hypothetical protein
MLNNAGATALGLMKGTTATLLIWFWNAFKACLTAGFLLLAWFAMWGAWMQDALGFAAMGVTAFLLCLAGAPWVIPGMYLRRKGHRTGAAGGSLVHG